MLKIIASVSDLAEGQDGLVTEEQAAAVGASPAVVRELLDSRVIESVIPGVVRVRGGARPRFPRLYAHWLLLVPEQPAWERLLPASGVVSHAAAVRLYGVGNLPGPAAEFTMSDTTVAAAQLDVALHRAALRTEEYQEVAGLPVTSPGRTLADLAAAGTTDPQDIGRIATNLLRQGLAQEEELAQALGAEQLAAYLATVDGAETLQGEGE